MKEKLSYLKYSVFHPFDAFYEIRFRGKGSVKLAAILFLLYGILQCISYQYTGFVMNYNPIFYMNSVSIFVSALSVLLLFVVSNWSTTTLFNGKGSMKDIFIVLGYSLIPLLVVQSFCVFMSNFVIKEEVMILKALGGMGILWFAFMMLAGLCTIHEYTFFKNLVTLIVTAIAAALIILIGTLFLTLMEQMMSFFTSVVQEFLRRT